MPGAPIASQHANSHFRVFVLMGDGGGGGLPSQQKNVFSAEDSPESLMSISEQLPTPPNYQPKIAKTIEIVGLRVIYF